MDKNFAMLAAAFALLLLSFGCTSGSQPRAYANITEANLTSPSAPNVATTSPPEQNYSSLVEKIIPSGGVRIGARWNDLGPKTIRSGALNITKLSAVMASNGKPLTEFQLALLEKGSDDFITIDKSNSYFLLDLFWAFGLVNKNPILDSGPASGETMPHLASTGGWPLGDRSGPELYSSAQLITLTQAQQQIVENVAKNTYRPCCNNPTAFPDCNHGMAALGLAEWMAYQNATEQEIYDALLAANRYWFPQTYFDTAVYLESQNIGWENMTAQQLLSAQYSSASGYANTRNKIRDLPGTIIRGGGCGV